MIKLTHDVYLDEVLYKCNHCNSDLVSLLIYKSASTYCPNCHKVIDPNPLSLFKSKLNRMSYHFHGIGEANEVKKKA